MKVLNHDDLITVVSLFRNEVCAITGVFAVYVLYGKVLVNCGPVIAPRTLFCPQVYGHVTTVSALSVAYYGRIRKAEAEIAKLRKLVGESTSLLVELFAKKCSQPTEGSSLSAIFVCIPVRLTIPSVYANVARVNDFSIHAVSASDVTNLSKAYSALSSSAQYAVEWAVAVQSISIPKFTIIVGPQGTGKSVFSRILANFKTGFYSAVIYIDSDCRNGESMCPSMLSAAVLRSGCKAGDDFPILGTVFTEHIPYGYTSVSGDPDTFIHLIKVLVHACQMYLQQQEVTDTDIPVIVNMPVWFQGTMDDIIERSVAELGCDGVVEMVTEESVSIVSLSDSSKSLTRWDQSKRRPRDNALTLPGVHHYIVQGLVGLPGMDHFRTLRSLQAIIDMKRYGLVLGNFKKTGLKYTARDLLYTACIKEVVMGSRQFTYSRIDDIATGSPFIDDDKGTIAIQYNFSTQPIALYQCAPDAEIPRGLHVSKTLSTVIQQIPEHKIKWALHTMFCAMPVYIFGQDTDSSTLSGSISFLGIGLVRNFNGWNPCIVTQLPVAKLQMATILCLPHSTAFFFSHKSLRCCLEGFITNMSMSQVIGHETYGGKGPNLLASERH